MILKTTGRAHFRYFLAEKKSTAQVFICRLFNITNRLPVFFKINRLILFCDPIIYKGNGRFTLFNYEIWLLK